MLLGEVIKKINKSPYWKYIWLLHFPKAKACYYANAFRWIGKKAIREVIREHKKELDPYFIPALTAKLNKAIMKLPIKPELAQILAEEIESYYEKVRKS